MARKTTKAESGNNTDTHARTHARRSRVVVYERVKLMRRFLAELEVTKGIVSVAARRAGVARWQVYDWHKRYAGFAALMDDTLREGRTELVDAAESVLWGILTNAEADAHVKSRTAQYILSTLGKERGYVQQQEHKHGGEVGIVTRLEGTDTSRI